MELQRFSFDHPVLKTPAIWHGDPAVPRNEFAVVLFRRTFQIKTSSAVNAVWVSASQRYNLYLDGELISRGPSRSDPPRWGVVRVALPKLSSGKHVLSACVWNFARHSGKGQMGAAAFFLLYLESEEAELSEQVSTGAPWLAWHDRSRTPLNHHAWDGARVHDVIGSGERIDGALTPWGWQQRRFDDSKWAPAAIVCRAACDDWGNQPLGHVLRPDPLPPMQETPGRFARVAEAPVALLERAGRWIRDDRALTIPANTSVKLLLDHGTLTNAYLSLRVSGGAGSTIGLITAEAPFDNHNLVKSNRDQTEGKLILGHLDELIPDGGAGRELAPLWFRAFRYAQFNIQTADQALKLERIGCDFTGYPMEPAAQFSAEDDAVAIERMCAISWRTIRLCAHETFFDCPHYEQAQFPGDSRVQAVYHYLWANDDGLARKAIDDFRASRTHEGLTLSHYPVRTPQVLPTFSLFWIGMLRDFRIYRGDLDFLQTYLPMAREILQWFQTRRRADGMLGHIEHAPFFDWTRAFHCGNAPQDQNGGSSLLTLLFADACRWQGDLEAACGFPELSRRWLSLAKSLGAATLRQCWDPPRGMLADTSSRATFSQHAQVQAILLDLWPARRAANILQRAMSDPTVAPPGTLYYRYYIAQALKRANLRPMFFELLEHWRALLEGTGLTTWPEGNRNSRSDCHAWSVTPAIEFLQTVLGIEPDPAADGFQVATFNPQPGNLRSVSGVVPTPHGEIEVDIVRSKTGDLRCKIASPVPIRVPAQNRILKPGKSSLSIRVG